MRTNPEILNINSGIPDSQLNKNSLPLPDQSNLINYANYMCNQLYPHNQKYHNICVSKIYRTFIQPKNTNNIAGIIDTVPNTFISTTNQQLPDIKLKSRMDTNDYIKKFNKCINKLGDTTENRRICDHHAILGN